MIRHWIPGTVLTTMLLGAITGADALADSTADLYEQASDQYDSLLESLQTEEVDFEAQFEILEDASRLPEAYDRKLDRLNDIITKVSLAARSEDCDWELDLSKGLLLELPHVLYIRNCQRIIQQDVTRQLLKGDIEKITDRLITGYSLCRHLGPDMFLTTLVNASIIDGFNDALDRAIEHGMMDPIQARRLLKVMNRLPKKDPCRLRPALRGERDLALATTESVLKANQEDWSEEDIMAFNMVFGLSGDTVENLIEGQGDLMPGLKRYWQDALAGVDSKTDDELADQMDDVNVKADEGEYGALTKFFATGPAMGTVVRKISKTSSDLEARKKLVQLIADGEINIMERANAARWYALAIRRVQDSEIPWWEHDDLRRTVLADLAMASMARNCQFAYPDDYLELHELEFMRWPEHVVPWWLPEMDDFIDYFLMESDRKMASDDVKGGLLDLAAACHIIAHLSRDPGVPSSILAGQRCMDVLDRLDPLVAGDLTEEHRLILRDALRNIPTTDPFGLNTATKASTPRLAYQLGLLQASNTLPELPAPRNPDDVLYAMAWLKDIVEPVVVPDVWYWPDGPWPDDLPGDPGRIETFDAEGITLTAGEGTQAREAWTLEIAVPIENLRNLTRYSAEELAEQGRIRLIDMRRMLR